MSLNIKELEIHAEYIESQIGQLEKLTEELTATRLLIKREQDRLNIQSTSDSKYANSTVDAAIRDLFTSGNHSWMSVQQVTSILHHKGMQQKLESLRANVGVTLKKLAELDILARRNASKTKQEMFVYILKSKADDEEKDI
jgi:hypothetical protein